MVSAPIQLPSLRAAAGHLGGPGYEAYVMTSQALQATARFSRLRTHPWGNRSRPSVGHRAGQRSAPTRLGFATQHAHRGGPEEHATVRRRGDAGPRHSIQTTEMSPRAHERDQAGLGGLAGRQRHVEGVQGERHDRAVPYSVTSSTMPRSPSRPRAADAPTTWPPPPTTGDGVHHASPRQRGSPRGDGLDGRRATPNEGPCECAHYLELRLPARGMMATPRRRRRSRTEPAPSPTRRGDRRYQAR